MLSYLSADKLDKIIKYLLYLVALTPLVLFDNFLFPYISTRTIFFRLLIETVSLIFLAIIFIYRPKIVKQSNYFLIVFSAFVVTNIISSFFSFSPSLAWFSDIERMWGIFTLLHLFLFYILIRGFFTGKEWKIFLNASLAVSIYVAVYGIAQHYPGLGIQVYQAGLGRIISTLGNSAYVAIYMLFNMFFALFLLAKSNNKWLRVYYALVVVLDFFAFNLASIRGTTLGLIAGGLIAGLLYILLGGKKSYKAGITIVIIAGSLIFFCAFLNPNGKLAQSNSILRRLATIEFSGGTIETRMVGWRAAWLGFKEHPIFGVGMDNYNTVFNKYFTANYYLIAPSEPYFDRSHNALLDVLVMNGLVGFVIFLGFPFFICYYLIKGYREEKIKLDELLIFLTLTVTYFIHLIFVFDDLNSYIYFVVLLAFVEYRYHKDKLILIANESQKSTAVKIIAGLAVIIIATAAYNLNIKVALACNKVIEAMGYSQDLEKSTALFKEALDYDIIPSRNILMSYVNQLSQLGNNYYTISSDQTKVALVKQSLAEVNQALDKEIKKDPDNSLLYDRKAIINNFSYIVYHDPVYIRSSLESSQKALELSREHLQYYYTLTDAYVISGQAESAIKTVQQSLEINNQYSVGYYYLAKTYLMAGQLDQALNVAKTLPGHNYTPPNNSFFLLLANKFEEQANLLAAIETMELALTANEKDAPTLVKLIKLYLKNGENDKATAAAKKLSEADANFAKDANYIIQQIAAGKTKELITEMEGNK